jgi:ZIP family zinc transporter
MNSLILLGVIVTFAATAAGSLPGLASRRLSESSQRVLLGFSAGVMLAASCFSLILPAYESLGEGAGRGILAVSSAILMGAGIVALLNLYVPHEHFGKGHEGPKTSVRAKSVWLFVMAIALHNFPEGLAVGTSVGSGDESLALPLLIGIGLQNLPEGFIVTASLITIGIRAHHALGVAILTGFIEALSAVLGYFLVVQVVTILPWALAFAGGAMIYVVSDEIIPETHEGTGARWATMGLMLGFVLMLAIDGFLGG